MRRHTSLLLVLSLVVAGAVPPAAAQATSPGDAETTARDAAVSPVGLAPTATQTAQNNSTTLTILSYNDVQTAAAENGTLPRLVTLIEQRRAAHDNPTVVVGGGDQVSPHSLSPLSQWRVPVKALNVVDPAAEVVGNHDLDYGFGAVANYSDASDFPWLMANIVDESTGEPIPGTEPYAVVERQGVKVGIVGVADEKIESKTAVDFDEQGYELEDYSETASEYATTLKQERNVDVVVVSAHLGVPVAKELANETEHVDAIVVGDDEVEYPPAETGGAVIVEAEARAEHLAELNLTVEGGEVTAWDGRLLDVTENVTKNETVASLVTDARKAELSKTAGRTEVALDARFSPNYHDETALGNMIGDAFLAQTGADVAVTNAGGIRSNSVYGPGNLTVGDVYNVLPFQNTLVTVELTGAEIEQLLASQVVPLESETGQQYGAEAQLQVGGVSYEWVGHNGTDQIRDVWVGGEPLDENETYEVTVNSYMAGWDGSVLENATVVSESHTLYGTALLNYVRENSPVSPTDANRIRRIDAEVATESVEVGEDTVTVSLAAPNGTRNVSDDFYAITGNASERLAAESATLDSGTVTVAFDLAELRATADGDAVQIYGGYNTSAYQRVYFENSVLNAEVSAEAFAAETTTATTTEPATTVDTTTATTREAPVEDATETTTGGDGADVPGFTPATAVVALLAAALVALRRN